MKNWKSLFVKSDREEETNSSTPAMDNFSFPTQHAASTPANTVVDTVMQEAVTEVLAVYEKGIDAINMPGYDFYEFYKAVSVIPAAGEQTYRMAFQMAKSMDKSITLQKLVADAEFYISKINEVHSQYNIQGEQKLTIITGKKSGEKSRLSQEIDQSALQLDQLRSQLKILENDINLKKQRLTSIEGEYQPQENSIRQKLMANDNARQISVLKLTAVKEGLQQHVK